MKNISEKELLDILETMDECRRFSKAYTDEQIKAKLTEGCEQLKDLMFKYHFDDEDEEDNVKRLYHGKYHYLDI